MTRYLPVPPPYTLVEYDRLPADVHRACVALLEEHGPSGGKVPNRGSRAWVVFLGADVVAVATVGRYSLHRHTWYRGVWMRNCAVAPSARGKGLQRALLHARESWARTIGAPMVASYTSADNWPSMTNLIDLGYRVWGKFVPDPDASGGGWVYWRKVLR